MLDEVIALIRRSPSAEESKAGLMELLDVDEIQATAILDMQLRRLAALERQKIVDELAEIERVIADLQGHPGQAGAAAGDHPGRADRGASTSTATTGAPGWCPTTATSRSRT